MWIFICLHSRQCQQRTISLREYTPSKLFPASFQSNIIKLSSEFKFSSDIDLYSSINLHIRSSSDYCTAPINSKQFFSTMAVLSRPISEPEVVLIVAIDFGTTWSGICWVFSNNVSIVVYSVITLTFTQLENPRVVRVWPASDGTVETSEKVPTRIAYDAEGKPYAWGLMIKGNQKRYQEFKLNLDDSRKAHHAKMANAYPDPASLPFTFPFKPAKLSIDFLHELREWLESDVDNEMGAGHFSSLKVEYVITVPAIWSDNAKKLTKFCAEKAGMGNNVKIISEPEAAMVYVIETLPEDDFEESACLTLCDAGGGTVDLITYRVKSLEPLQVEEVIVGDGDRCGSVFIDRQFKCYIEAIYGKLATWSTQDTLDAVDCFERITKRKFDDGDDDLIVKVSPKHAYDKTKARVKKGKMFVPAADIRQMFAASADIIVVLISEQRRRALKLGLHIMGVLLVGGFGQSKYLQNQLETALKKLDKDLKLYLARDAWTAVERGALSRLLPVVGPKQAQAKVAARIARRHYGITRSREYHPFQDQNMEHKKSIALFVQTAFQLTHSDS